MKEGIVNATFRLMVKGDLIDMKLKRNLTCKERGWVLVIVNTIKVFKKTKQADMRRNVHCFSIRLRIH